MLMSAKAKDTFRSAYVCMYQKKENDVRKRRKRVAIVASVGDALTILSVNSSNSNTQ
jgi:ssDNA-specific exonuclease RecJ